MRTIASTQRAPLPALSSPGEAPTAERYRYESKFLITDLTRPQVELLLRLNPAMFAEIYHARDVNNIYLDSWCRTSCTDNLDGRSRDRVKSRIRWYGALQGVIERPVLEFKIKHGQVNRKLQYPLEPFEMNGGVRLTQLHELFRRAQLPKRIEQDLLKLEPSLVNRYRRNYFLTADRRLRATLDSDLEFNAISPAGACTASRFRATGVLVLELKYDAAVADSISHVTQQLPFRLSRSSKYVLGIERLSTL